MVGFDRLIWWLLWRLLCRVLLRILGESGENCLEVRLLGHVVYWKCDEFLVVVSIYASCRSPDCWCPACERGMKRASTLC